MATFIFDFDDTLFNAQELKRIIFNKLKEYGTSHESVERTYKELRTTKENYNLSFHRDELNTTHDFLIPKNSSMLASVHVSIKQWNMSERGTMSHSSYTT